MHSIANETMSLMVNGFVSVLSGPVIRSVKCLFLNLTNTLIHRLASHQLTRYDLCKTPLLFSPHRSLPLILLSPRGVEFKSSDVSRRACGRPHRYDSKCPLPSPQPRRNQKKKKFKKGTCVTHFTICRQKHTHRAGNRAGGGGAARTKQKLISSGSPAPLTAGVALAVTGNLSDGSSCRD